MLRPSTPPASARRRRRVTTRARAAGAHLGLLVCKDLDEPHVRDKVGDLRADHGVGDERKEVLGADSGHLDLRVALCGVGEGE